MMSEGHSAVLYGVTIGGPGSVAAPAIPYNNLQTSATGKQCSVSNLLEQKVKTHSSNSASSWLLPAHSLQPLPHRERQLPANWLTENRCARQSKRVQPSAGEKQGKSAVMIQPKDGTSFLAFEQPGSTQLGPYAPQYGEPRSCLPQCAPDVCRRAPHVPYVSGNTLRQYFCRCPALSQHRAPQEARCLTITMERASSLEGS